MEKILENIKNGKYENKRPYPKKPEGYKKELYIYDENQTVKWNKDRQQQLTEWYIKDLDEFQNESNRVSKLFREDLIKEISYQTKLSEKQSEVIYNKAWEEGHADGMESVVYEARDLVDLILEIISNK